MIEWRWDQGRVLYFQFDVLREIAKVLVKFNGKNINENSMAEIFKETLISETGMPFAPEHYKVNRNYSRVFQCALLATTKNKKELVVSDICKLLASGNYFENCDDYLYEVVKRFRFPFPAFQEYDFTSQRVYPFCAIIKFLIAKKEDGKEPKVNINDISNYIIGNQCTGLEDVEFYKSLKPSGYLASGDNLRQLREIIVFISQLSFLKAFDKHLYLDVYDDQEVHNLLSSILCPLEPQPEADKFEEFLSLTTKTSKLIIPQLEIATSKTFTPSVLLPELEFTEGKRRRIQHLRIERSPLLRKFYILENPDPICAACEQNIKIKYPWVDYMLDLHHLLPLSSVIKTSEKGTSLEDMVGLCPSCHRAIHSYYKKWLKANSLDDFRSKKEAMQVYLDAIKEIA